MICSLSACLLSNILWPFEIHSFSSRFMALQILLCGKKLGNEETIVLNRSNQNIELSAWLHNNMQMFSHCFDSEVPAIMGNIAISVTKTKKLDMLVGRNTRLSYIVVQFAHFNFFFFWVLVQTSFLYWCWKVEWQEGSRISPHKGHEGNVYPVADINMRFSLDNFSFCFLFFCEAELLEQFFLEVEQLKSAIRLTQLLVFQELCQISFSIWHLPHNPRFLLFTLLASTSARLQCCLEIRKYYSVDYYVWLNRLLCVT